MLRYNEIIENEKWFSLEDLANITGYSTDVIRKEIFSRLGDLPKTNFKAVGSAHKKYYNTKVLEAIKAYQLKAHGNMKNADVANKSYLYDRESICKICNVDVRTFSNFLSNFGRESTFPSKTKNIGGHKNVKFYTEEVVKQFQMWLKNNAINAGGQKTETSVIKQDNRQDLFIGCIATKGSPEEIESLAEHLKSVAQQKRDNIALETENKQLEAQLEVQRPMVDFYTAVTGSEDTIGIGEVAKILNVKGIGRNTLFEILRNKGVLQSNNIPYQRYVDRGYFRVIESKYTLPNGDVKVSLRTVVYQTGLNFIRNLLKTDKKVDYLVEKSVDR